MLRSTASADNTVVLVPDSYLDDVEPGFMNSVPTRLPATKNFTSVPGPKQVAESILK